MSALALPVEVAPAPGALRSCAILAALDDELRPLLGRTSRIRRERVGACRTWRGRLAGVEVVLASTGMGRRAADDGAAALFEREAPDLLVVVGVSGALSPRVEPGAIFASSRLLDGPAAGPDPDLLRLPSLLAIDGVRPAAFVTSRRILSEPAQKLELGARVGADVTALIDLETAGYAAAARAAGVPWIGLRAVLDPAEETLPFDFESLRGPAGELGRARVAMRALGEPRSWTGLIRLRSRLRRGAEGIARVIVPWLEDQAHA